MRLLICVLLIVTLVTCKNEKKKIVKYHSNGNIEIYAPINEDSLADGFVQIFFESGALKSKSYYNCGLKDGEFSKYYESGNLEVTGSYNDGLKSGKFTYYLDNTRNSLEQSEHYREDLEYGNYYFYREDSTLSSMGYVENDTTKFYSNFNEQEEITEIYSEDAIFLQKQKVTEGSLFKINFKVYGMNKKKIDFKYYLVDFINEDTLLTNVVENYELNTSINLDFKILKSGDYFIDFYIPLLDTLVISTKAIRVR